MNRVALLVFPSGGSETLSAASARDGTSSRRTTTFTKHALLRGAAFHYWLCDRVRLL